MLVIFDSMDSAKNLKKRNVVTCKLLYGKKKTEEAGLRTGKGSSINYVITFGGLGRPPPSLCNTVIFWPYPPSPM